MKKFVLIAGIAGLLLVASNGWAQETPNECNARAAEANTIEEFNKIINECKQIRKTTSCPTNVNEVWTNCFGTFNYPNGDQYTGEWKDDKRHGQGAYTFADDKINTGVFENLSI